MINIFGFNFYSAKEQKELDDAYAAQMFPYGEPQREAVSRILKELCPKSDPKTVMFFYLVLKQALMEDRSLTLPQVMMRAKLRSFPAKVSPEAGQAIFRLCLADLDCGESLSYPSVSELMA